MIKINLLGKKKASAQGVPFGLDEKLAKLGVSGGDIQELRPHLVRVGIMAVGIYLANYIPGYIYTEKMREVDEKLQVSTTQQQTLLKELNTKKDMRRQMEELNQGETELQRQLSAIAALQKDRSLGFRTVDNMLTVLPSKVWVKTVSYSKRKVRVSGASWEYFPINDFVKSITEAAQFRDVIFRGIQTEAAKTKVPGIPEQLQRIKNFEMEFTAKGAEEF